MPRPAPRVAPATTAIFPSSRRRGTAWRGTLETCLGVRLVGINYGYWRFQKASIPHAAATVFWLLRSPPVQASATGAVSNCECRHLQERSSNQDMLSCENRSSMFGEIVSKKKAKESLGDSLAPM